MGVSKRVKKEKEPEMEKEPSESPEAAKPEASKYEAIKVVELPKSKKIKVDEAPKPKKVKIPEKIEAPEELKIPKPPKPKAPEAPIYLKPPTSKISEEAESDLTEALEILEKPPEKRKISKEPESEVTEALEILEKPPEKRKISEEPESEVTEALEILGEVPEESEISEVSGVSMPITLDDLGVEAIEGIGSKIGAQLNSFGIETLQDLIQANPFDIYKQIQMPVYKTIEYQKKAQMVLELDIDDEIINALAANDYTVEQAIEEDLQTLITITKNNKDKVTDFLTKIVQVSMFLSAHTCRTNSIAVLHRSKKVKPKVTVEKKPRVPVVPTAATLEALSIEAIDGIGPRVAAKLNQVAISTLDHLARCSPAGIYKAIQIPIHKLMEYKKKAQMILQLELDETIINALAAENYSIAQAIEEDPEVIKKLSGVDRDQVMEFLGNLIQITMFLDAATVRTNSIAIVHKAKKEPGKPQVEIPEMEEVHYLGKEQILAKIYSTELDITVLNLLRERARNKSEIQKILENKLLKVTPFQLNQVIDSLVQTELIQMEWFEGNFDVHLFLISDFAIFRAPPPKIIEEAEKNLPTPTVAKRYLADLGAFFNEYRPTEEDNLLIAQQLRDPDIYVTLSLIRGKIYPLKKFPKGVGETNVDMVSIIKKMEEAGILKIYEDETKEEWVILLTDIKIPQFYPEYMMENIRKDAAEKVLAPVLAVKHLDLLELHYNTFTDMYSKFFKPD